MYSVNGDSNRDQHKECVNNDVYCLYIKNESSTK